jgi:hypothetical protein
MFEGVELGKVVAAGLKVKSFRLSGTKVAGINPGKDRGVNALASGRSLVFGALVCEAVLAVDANRDRGIYSFDSGRSLLAEGDGEWSFDDFLACVSISAGCEAISLAVSSSSWRPLRRSWSA